MSDLDLVAAMKKVINLEPGQSAPFLFYNVYLIDKTDMSTMPEGFTFESLINNSATICRSGQKGGGLGPSFITKAIEASRYIVVALDREGGIGSFVLAHEDHQDPLGIYVEASCNTPLTTVKRMSDEYVRMKEKITAEVAVMPAEEAVEKLIASGKNVNIGTFNRMASTYRPVLVKRMLEALNLEPVEENINVRTAQLLKLTMFKYAAKKLHMKHAYNAAASAQIANFHARNGMVLRTANCGERDDIALEFAGIPYEGKVQYMENAVKTGKFKKDKTDSYPMKLCNYNIDVLFTELADHTLQTVIRILSHGFTMDDINGFIL